MAKNEGYKAQLRRLQIALVRYQQAQIKSGARDVVIFEGRDAAGKDGAIRRIVEHLSVRNTRVAALPKPHGRQLTEWYFQRYVRHLPAAGELVIFNRSWYNRAGVEPVMGFCTEAEHETFLQDAPRFEAMLAESGIRIVKIWLDISRKEQADRLKVRESDPLKVLKVSDLDYAAQERWDAYSHARDVMLTRTHTLDAPWVVVHTDHKKQARLNTIRYLLKALAPKSISRRVDDPDPDIVYEFGPAAVSDGRLEH